MTLTFHTATGIHVQLQPALFQTVLVRGAGPSAETQTAPSAPVGAGLLETVRRNGGVATSTALLTMEQTSIGVLFACGNGHLAALVFDLAEPEVRRWLDTARHTGNLPLALTGPGKGQLVRLPVDEDITRLVEHTRECVPASVDDLMMALQAVVGQFDDAAQLAHWGVDIARLTHGSVSLLTPTAALQNAASALH